MKPRPSGRGRWTVTRVRQPGSHCRVLLNTAPYMLGSAAAPYRDSSPPSYITPQVKALYYRRAVTIPWDGLDMVVDSKDCGLRQENNTLAFNPSRSKVKSEINTKSWSLIYSVKQYLFMYFM